MKLSSNPGSLGLQISPQKVDLDLTSSWNDIHSTFESIECLELWQVWLKEPGDIEKGVVKVAWNGENLLVYSDFDDSYIFNLATRFNDPVRSQGDFLEIILKPEGQVAYYELHVTPDNQRSQFRFPRAECVREIMDANPGKSIVEVFGFDFPIFSSKTKVNKNRNKWYAIAEINLQSIIEGEKRVPSRYFYNFCRKNVFESGEPELSSTVELSELDYHHQNEWGTISLGFDKPIR